MNRNFLKISVALVALLLALVLCLTGCKVDDVAADLNSTKDEVSANKADATAALNEAVKALEAKIAANDTDVTAEIAKVNAAIQAVETSGAEADAEIESAQAALQASIDMVQKNLEETKKEVSDKLAANDASLNEKLAELNKAIADAKEVLKLADATDVAKLMKEIEDVEKTFGTKIEEVVANVADLKKDVEFWISELEDADAATLAAAKAELEALLAKVGEMDTQVKADLGVQIADAIKIVDDKLETYKLTTDDVINAYYNLNKILKIYNEVSASYGETYIMEGENKVAVDLDRALTTVQIKLYRATTPEDVTKCEKEFFEIIENIQSDNLTILRGIHEKLIAAETELANDDDLDPTTKVNLPATKAALVEAKAALDLTFSAVDAKLIVGGEVVDLKAMYTTLWEDYCATRISEIESYIEDAEAGIADAEVTYDALWAVDGDSLTISDNLATARTELDALIADNDTLADADKVSAETINALEAAYNTARQNRVKAAIAIVTADIADVTNKADVDRDTTDETTTVDAKIEFIATENSTITDAIDMTAVQAARDAKYVDIYAAELTVKMNAYIDNLKAIHTDVNAVIAGEDSAIDAIRTEFDKVFVDTASDYTAIYTAATTEAVTALKAAEEKFQTVETQDDALTALLGRIEAIVETLDNEEFKAEDVTDEDGTVTGVKYPNISGTKTEFDLLNKYDSESTKWIADLDVFYKDNAETADVVEGFTATEENNAEYEAIKALIRRADYDKYDAAFEIAIAELKEVAVELIAKMNALMNATKVEAEDGSAVSYTHFTFKSNEMIQETWDAYWAWVGLAGDGSGVGFVIEWVSEGELEQAELLETINKIDTNYKRWMNQARIDWAKVYTDEVSKLTVDNVTIYNDIVLADVIEWFETYGHWDSDTKTYECLVDADYVSVNALGNIGTSEIEATIREVDAKRAELLAGAKNGITSITNNEFAAITVVSTHEADVKIIEAARAAYDKWVEDFRIDVDHERNADLGVVFDITTLTTAESELKALEDRLADLILAIEGIDTTMQSPYFKNDGVKNNYKMNVDAIADEVETFASDNTCSEGCTECINQDLQDQLAEGLLIVAKYETLATFKAKAEEYRAQINTESEFATWANDEIDNLVANAEIEIEEFNINTPNVYVVLSAICGDQADADFAEIIAKAK